MSIPLITLSGLPGKMAALVRETILKREVCPRNMDLSSIALTGLEQPREFEGVHLKPPKGHDSYLSRFLGKADSTIIVDFTQPDVVNRNAELYCKLGIPFVMGTTGGDRKALEQAVVDSRNIAVIAPNMAKPIVLLQAMLEYAAQTFPGALKGFEMGVTESHQAAKKDTSGTAKAMVAHFNQLGVPFDVQDIWGVRDPTRQLVCVGVPPAYLDGHGYHQYDVFSRDSKVRLKIEHNVDGRQVYADGAIDAIKFLHRKVQAGERGKVYSMIDVLKEGKAD